MIQPWYHNKIVIVILIFSQPVIVCVKPKLLGNINKSSILENLEELDLSTFERIGKNINKSICRYDHGVLPGNIVWLCDLHLSECSTIAHDNDLKDTLTDDCPLVAAHDRVVAQMDWNCLDHVHYTIVDGDESIGVFKTILESICLAISKWVEAQT